MPQDYIFFAWNKHTFILKNYNISLIVLSLKHSCNIYHFHWKMACKISWFLSTYSSEELLPKRDNLARLLSEAGLQPVVPEGGYFMMADVSGKSEFFSLYFYLSLPFLSKSVFSPNDQKK